MRRMEQPFSKMSKPKRRADLMAIRNPLVNTQSLGYLPDIHVKMSNTEESRKGRGQCLIGKSELPADRVALQTLRRGVMETGPRISKVASGSIKMRNVR